MLTNVVMCETVMKFHIKEKFLEKRKYCGCPEIKVWAVFSCYNIELAHLFFFRS